MAPRFAIPPDSPLLHDGRRTTEVFAWDHAVIIIGVHLAAIAGLAFASVPGLLVLVAAHYVVLCLGISIGFHRLLTHQSFVASKWVTRALATLGTLALESGPLAWAAVHRAHHAHTDETGDAHAASRGFWWSHVGWAFFKTPNGFDYAGSRSLIRDLVADSYLRWLDRYAVVLNLVVLAVFALLVRRADLVFWAFPVRIVLDWHISWLINSYTHSAPLRAGAGAPAPRNSPTLALLAWGEGWHLNHHHAPGRANFAVGARQIDPAFWTLKLLRTVRLVRLRPERSERQLPSSEPAASPPA